MDPKADDPTQTDDSAPVTAAPTGHDDGDECEWVVPPEVLPNLDELVIEDEAPVDAIRTEKQQRLLTEALYAGWPGPGEGRPFQVFANVGLFYTGSPPPLVPDVMLSLDLRPGNQGVRENRSYFVWIVGKAPEVVIEIVSDRRGGEAAHKLREYSRAGVPYYVIYDPDEHLREGVLRAFALCGGAYERTGSDWLTNAGLGLTLWQGSYEGLEDRWLRWCDREGRVIPTGQERAEQAEQRAGRLVAQLRALGVDPTA